MGPKRDRDRETLRLSKEMNEQTGKLRTLSAKPPTSLASDQRAIKTLKVSLFCSHLVESLSLSLSSLRHFYCTSIGALPNRTPVRMGFRLYELQRLCAGAKLCAPLRRRRKLSSGRSYNIKQIYTTTTTIGRSRGEIGAIPRATLRADEQTLKGFGLVSKRPSSE